MSNLEFLCVFQSLLAKQPPTAAGRPVVSIADLDEGIKISASCFSSLMSLIVYLSVMGVLGYKVELGMPLEFVRF